MPDFGITPTGFNRKRLDELLDEINVELRSIFGDNFNVSPESPDGQVNGVISESNANLWEIAEEAYDTFNPNAATGAALSSLVQLNAITRKAAEPSLVSLDLTGTLSTLIPEGSLISTADDVNVFLTIADVTLDGAGNGTVSAISQNTGPIEALAGTITKIVTPITGWDTVTNPLDAVLGQNEETDPELRTRRTRSVARGAQAIIDAITAEILNVVGVTKAIVLENDTDTGPDVNGLPAHSVNAIVVGGADADIAQAIFIKKTLGATPFGTTTEAVLDSQGISHSISFSRATEIDIYVIVNVTNLGPYPTNGDDLIKQAIVDYANGDLILDRGFSLGDDVIHSELYTPINSIGGMTVDSLFIDITPSPAATSDIAIAVTEISNFLVANIIVNS